MKINNLKMKKILIHILPALIIFSCKEKESKPKGNLHLTGKVAELYQGKIYIQKMKDTTTVVEDTIVFSGKDEFDTHITIDEPQMIYLFLDRGRTESQDNNLAFFAEPGEMTLNTTLKEFFAQAKVTGSKNQKLYEEYLSVDNDFTNKNLELIKKSFEIKDKNFDVDKEKNKLLMMRYLYSANFAKNHANNEIAPYIALNKIPDATTPILDTIYNSLTPKIIKSKYGKIFTDFINSRKLQDKQIK